MKVATQVIKENKVVIKDNKPIRYPHDIHSIASVYVRRELSYKALKQYDKAIKDFEILKIFEENHVIDRSGLFGETIYIHLVGLYLLNNHLDKALKAENDLSFLLNSRFNNEYQDKLNKLEALEKTYEENLKLSEPAKYFEEKGKEYTSKSKIFFCLFVGSIGGFIVWLIIAICLNLFKTSLAQWYTLIPYLSISALWVFVILFFRSIYLQNNFLAEEMKQKHTLLYTYLAFYKEQTEKNIEEQNIREGIFRQIRMQSFTNEEYNNKLKLLEKDHDIQKLQRQTLLEQTQADLLKAIFNISRFKISKNFDLKELISLLSALKK